MSNEAEGSQDTYSCTNLCLYEYFIFDLITNQDLGLDYEEKKNVSIDASSVFT